jgi:hypothetical protein
MQFVLVVPHHEKGKNGIFNVDKEVECLNVNPEEIRRSSMAPRSGGASACHCGN